MKIAIIGAGFTGLAAGFTLSKKGHNVFLFEKRENPGGLALGFKKPNWQWSLEEYYHHWFTNDHNVLSVAKEIKYPVFIKRPKTSVFVDNEIFQLDSPFKLLEFPKLKLLDRLRMAMVLGMLKSDPFWKPFEKVKAETVLKKAMGERGYKKIWEPQLSNKFGEFAKDISLAWFWARVVKRTSSLAYPEGGFLEFAKKFAEEIEKLNGKIIYGANVAGIENVEGKISLGKEYGLFDKVIVTLPGFAFTKICKNLPESYIKTLTSLQGLGAQTLVIRLSNQFLTDNTYWLSICEKANVTAIVEHTNFMDKKYYDNEHIVYLGNYLPRGHKYFSMTEKDLLLEFDPLLKRLNKDYKKHLIGADLFTTPFAQPIIPINYSRIMPPIKTPIKNVYLANIQQVYPWDRGTNYAVELGQKVADYIFLKTDL